VTGPVQRLCRLLAGKGYLVGSPESYHEFEPPGTILAYDTVGTDRGNALKIEKELVGYDNDAAALAAYLLARPDCSGRLGAVGMCLGGHLAFRAALVKEVSAAVCLFPTDIHKGSLGKGGDDTMSRIPELADGNKEFVMVFGKQVWLQCITTL
jgi:carboxymethylenebutenolidase